MGPYCKVSPIHIFLNTKTLIQRKVKIVFIIKTIPNQYSYISSNIQVKISIKIKLKTYCWSMFNLVYSLKIDNLEIL